MKNKLETYTPKQKYLKRVADSWDGNGMLFRFYSWILKKKIEKEKQDESNEH